MLEKEAFSVDPNNDDPLIKYVAWPFEDIITKRGADKFKKFYETLDALSKVVIQMIESDYFESSERV